MPAEHPLALGSAVDFEAVRRFRCSLNRILCLGRPTSIRTSPSSGRNFGKKLVSNSIQMLKWPCASTRVSPSSRSWGFLQEIAAGELAWRPFRSRAINELKLGLLVP